jgi:digeranylgeranylglycerophospholipid reductase
LHDVIVVGGGPVGSRIAYLLSSAGYDVVVLEKKSDPGEPVCCTGIISRECINSYSIDSSVILRGLKGASIISPGGTVLRVERPEMQAYVIDRGALNSLMFERASKAGANYVLGCTVRHFEIKPDFVSVTAVPYPGERHLTSRCLVDAAGFSPNGADVRRPRITDFVMGAQTEVELSGTEEVEVYLGRRYAPGFFAWLVPTSGNRGLAGLLSRRNSAAYLDVFTADLEKRRKIGRTYKPSFRPIPLRPSARNSGRRLIIAGSAAGQVKPLTGGGIYYGLICADIAAGTLCRALAEGDFSSNNLSAYGREWREQLGREIKTSYIARKFFELLSDRQIDRVFQIAGELGIVESYLKDSEVSFDRHSEVAKKFIREKALYSVWRMVKPPFFSRGNN